MNLIAKQKIKAKLLIPLAILGSILLLVMIFVTKHLLLDNYYHNNQRLLHTRQIDILHHVSEIKIQTEIISTLFANNLQIINIIETKDSIDDKYSKISKIFETNNYFNQKIITDSIEINIYNQENEIIYSNNKITDNLNISKNLNKIKDYTANVRLKNNALTAISVAKIFNDNNNLIGYIEICIKIETLIQEIKVNKDEELALYLNKKNTTIDYLNSTNFFFFDKYSLIKFSNKFEISNINNNEILELDNMIFEKQNFAYLIIPIQNNELQEIAILVLQLDTKTYKKQIFYSNFILIFISFLLVIMIIIVFNKIFNLFIFKRITKVDSVLQNLSEGKRAEMIEINNKDEISVLENSINKLNSRLLATTKYAKQIGQSNFDVKFTPLSSQDELGKSLLEMRDRLNIYTTQMEDLVIERTQEIRQTNEELLSIQEALEFQNKRLLDNERKLLKLSVAVENSANTIVITDKYGNIEYVNKKFEILTGYLFDEVKGKNPKALNSGHHSKEHFINLWDNIKSGKTWSGEFLNKKKNGELYWESATITPVNDDTGETFYIAIKEDITKRKKAEQELINANNELNTQKELLEQKNKSIIDSINYASRIQNALLPNDEFLKQVLPDFFVYYLPKDIVSGDFLWINQLENGVLIAAGDCTGHGVPGAFMSMLGISLLNDITKEFLRPDLILNNLRERILKSLQHNNNSNALNDGMDMAVINLQFAKMKMQYAGAMNSVYIVRSEAIEIQEHENIKISNLNDIFLIDIKADAMPVGLFRKMKDFNLQSIDLLNNDKIYLFSDGYVSQFGEISGRKYMTFRLKNLLMQGYKENMASQKQLLEDEFQQWKGDSQQIDDILIIGIEIKNEVGDVELF